MIWGTRKNEDGTDRVPDPNLRIWSVPDGKLLATIIANKQVGFSVSRDSTSLINRRPSAFSLSGGRSSLTTSA